MPASATERRQVRFGPFTVDLVSRELRHRDVKIRLQELPFQILTILVKQPGEWVSREELRQQLWPADTFVDFEHSINTAIGKLRKALGDDAGQPRYIETLPKRGYRFIAPLEEAPTEVLKAERRNLWKIVVPAAVLLLAALIIGWLYYPWRTAEALTDKDTVVLADINNKTGDEVFDEALKQGLAVELRQSPFLNVLSDEKVSESLGMMGRPTNQPITVDVGREVCQRTNSKAVLTGTISRLGSHYVIGLDAIACSTGDTLAKEQGEAASKEEVLNTLSRTCSTLRSQLGESLASVQKFDVPVEATTPSIEALRYFSIGLTVRHKEGDAASIPFLKRATELDPNFPLAYAELSLAYSNLRQPSRAMEYVGRAYQLRDRATKREQLNIAAQYFNATGELDKEIQTYQLWTADYPRSPVPYANLGADYSAMGENDRARAEFQEALRLAPDVVNVYSGLAAADIFLNRLDEAKATFDQALARKLDDGGLRVFMYYLAFLRTDAAGMEEQVTWAAGKPGDEDTLLSAQSDTEAYYGRMEKAQRLSHRAVDSAIHADFKEAAALWQVNAALREAEVGNAVSARQGVAAALALSQGRDVEVNAALALARIGEGSGANTLVEELEKDYPTNTVLKLYWLPTIKAAIELSRGNSSQALVLLETVAPHELAEGLNLYPAYLRGQAYLQAHNGMAAVAEFQKMLDHSGVMLNFVTRALAHLQIGRAYAMAGDVGRAKAAYQEFFFLWKTADPGTPILKQAKAEYEKMQ
jgi:DNA-binding winged helix-turn-helix (wHTH) protein/Tfp pilus assembly protein PilF